jgi:2-iminobutanoate/2-iminopropanoate deaminase
LANVAALLQGEGASLHQIVKTTMFLCSMGDFEVVNEEYAAAFGDHRPARSTVAVGALPLGALIELEAWAYEEAP